MTPPPSVPITIRRLSREFSENGIPSADAEARLLVAHVLGVPLARLPLADPPTDAQLSKLDDLARKRLSGIPLQHLTGRAAFRTIEVAVGPGVFIPRPETELVAGWVIDWLRAQSADRAAPSRIVELGAGTGAISLAIAAEAPGQEQWVVERSPEALSYLRRNVEASGVEVSSSGEARSARRSVGDAASSHETGSVAPSPSAPGSSLFHVIAGDMADALPESLDGLIDVVVVNPPYIPLSEAMLLPGDVLHDPAEALFSGADGLDAIRVVARVARRLLRSGGALAVEHGDGQAQAVGEIFSTAGFIEVVSHDDLTGRARFVTASAPSSADSAVNPRLAEGGVAK
ncbi:MAG: peptide chain release factor N(5)-glutamine methyltransferase [Propionibacteriaceae bacterium]|jgi:release factor glutamine methyltransferase|nr:peptide chain release factor N(5)-glutamine methyltransferase [Propionibacteriaceae bacterium]